MKSDAVYHVSQDHEMLHFPYRDDDICPEWDDAWGFLDDLFMAGVLKKAVPEQSADEKSCFPSHYCNEAGGDSK